MSGGSTDKDVEVLHSYALRSQSVADVSVVVNNIADGNYRNVALQFAHFSEMTFHTLAVYGSIDQLGYGYLTDTKVVTADAVHFLGYSVAVLEILDACVGVYTHQMMEQCDCRGDSHGPDE